MKPDEQYALVRCTQVTQRVNETLVHFYKSVRMPEGAQTYETREWNVEALELIVDGCEQPFELGQRYRLYLVEDEG